jgi:DNA-directed RNA polymerase subunit RPC12/RpoP
MTPTITTVLMIVEITYPSDEGITVGVKDLLYTIEESPRQIIGNPKVIKWVNDHPNWQIMKLTVVDSWDRSYDAYICRTKEALSQIIRPKMKHWLFVRTSQEDGEDISVYKCPICKKEERFLTHTLHHNSRAQCRFCRTRLLINIFLRSTAEGGRDAESIL